MTDGGPEGPAIAAAAHATPWGPVYLAASPRGIAAVELMTTRESFEAGLERRFGCRVRWVDAADFGLRRADATRHLQAAVAALGAGTAGRGDEADLEALDHLPLDLEDRPTWDRMVLAAVRAIPRGETRSYGEIARAIGRPGAARAVGGAVGRNPVSLLIPCHRVIAGDGTLGGYGGDAWGSRDERLTLKRELLLREGITVRNRGR